MAKEDPKMQSESTLGLQALANELDTVSQRLKNTLAAQNIEWPEDSQEGNTDRKYFRSLSEGKAGVDSVWDNVAKVDAKMLAVIETVKRIDKDALNSYDELNMRKKAVITDHVEQMAALHTGLIRNTAASMQPVISGNQIASTREVAQDANMNDMLKFLGNAVELLVARVDGLETALKENPRK